MASNYVNSGDFLESGGVYRFIKVRFNWAVAWYHCQHSCSCTDLNACLMTQEVGCVPLAVSLLQVLWLHRSDYPGYNKAGFLVPQKLLPQLMTATHRSTVPPNRQVIDLGVEGNPRLLGMLCSSRPCFQASHQLIQVSIYGRINLGSDCKMFCRNWAKSYSNKNSNNIRAILLLVTSVNQFKVTNIPHHKYILILLVFLL